MATLRLPEDSYITVEDAGRDVLISYRLNNWTAVVFCGILAGTALVGASLILYAIVQMIQ